MPSAATHAAARAHDGSPARTGWEPPSALLSRRRFVRRKARTPGFGQARSVLVAYDYEANAPMAVPEDWRTRLDAYEERSSVAT